MFDKIFIFKMSFYIINRDLHCKFNEYLTEISIQLRKIICPSDIRKLIGKQCLQSFYGICFRLNNETDI